MDKPYDHRKCQSLFGYAQRVHERSGGFCQLRGCGASGVDVDLWRQLTWEHTIGEKQGGYLKQIRAAFRARFPGLTAMEVDRLAHQIEADNTVTARSFRNSATSRDRAPSTMQELIGGAPGDPNGVLDEVKRQLGDILEAKRRKVR